MNIPNANGLARTSAALISAMFEARTMIGAGHFGPELADLLQHARELHELIGEELATAGAAVGEYTGGLYAAMGDRLKELEALLRPNAQ